jgi:hypothetical protein
MWARKEERLSQQKVNHCPNATWHYDNDQHPERCRHSTSSNIAAHIPYQQYITRERRPPRIPHQQSHRQQFMLVMGQYAMKKVLNGPKYNNCQYNRPSGDETKFIITAL